jgi:hypothetical protein
MGEEGWGDRLFLEEPIRYVSDYHKARGRLGQKGHGLKAEGREHLGIRADLIEKEHRARANREAAAAYQQFLNENPEVRAAMEVWESAPLVDEVEPKKP